MLRNRTLLAVALLALTWPLPVASLVDPVSPSTLTAKEFTSPDLSLAWEYARPVELPRLADGGLAALGVSPDNALLDVRSGRWVTLLAAQPLLPGSGVGNQLSWNGLGQGAGPQSIQEMEVAAWGAFSSWLHAHESVLQIDMQELSPRVTVQGSGDLIQITSKRHVRGIPVLDSTLNAVIRHGNLVLFGAANWGDVAPASEALTTTDASRSVDQFLGGEFAVGGTWEKNHLAYIPTTVGARGVDLVPGQGYEYRLVWVVSPRIKGSDGRWQAKVDAVSGEVLSFEDQNHYQTARQVAGGVLPITNDEMGVEGTEQALWPTPFADVTDDQGNAYLTDSGGNVPVCLSGDITTHLDSAYVRMLDGCNPSGNPTEVSSNTGLGEDNIDLGVAPPFGSNCTASTNPAVGNTRATRTGFYEVNRIAEQARGQLPDNLWLRDKLTANMNIANACNAFWNGSSINFYLGQSPACANTGEIAAIFDHEWGHGMDNFDANATIARPGSEGIADAYMFLRLNTSCLGRGFSAPLGCNSPARGYGDPCNNDCNGIRELNYHNRTTQAPHGVSFMLSNCNSGGPQCNGTVHCEGASASETVFDLERRDLACHGLRWQDTALHNGPVEGGQCISGGAPTMDIQTTKELVTRLTYLGAAPVFRWFTCQLGGVAGCIADGAYLNYLAVDDDDGDLTNGTPHMTAIFDAFERRDIHCDAFPAVVQDFGCSVRPTTPPVVTATPLDRAVRLSWSPVADADYYEVFRAEGVFGCDAGKTKVASIDSSFCGATCEVVVDELQNGFEYYFKVLPLSGAESAANTCVGPMNTDCTTATPVAGVNLGVNAETATLNILDGDGDIFLDNCEQTEVQFDVFNTGAVSQANVRITDVRPINLPGFSVDSSLPVAVAATLAPCETGNGVFTVTADGLAFQDDFAFEIDLTSDELAAQGITRTFIVGFAGLGEGDFANQASLTWDYETDLESWIVERGVFRRATGGGNPDDPDGDLPVLPDGAGGSSFYLRTSADRAGQCDILRSPLLRLTASSTLSLQNQWDIEGDGGTGTWYDRANVRLIDPAANTETVVDPDGGAHPYNVPDGAANGTCNTEAQPGWAATSAGFGTNGGWGDATFSATALDSAALAGTVLRLGINHGTDPGTHLDGFFVDQINLTDFDLHVPDAGICGGNLPPVAVPDNSVAVVGVPEDVFVLANDSDPNGDPLEITAFDAVGTNGGSVALNDNGSPGDTTDDYLVYTGIAGGQDTFTYTIGDGLGGFDTATVTVEVAGLNNPPIAEDDAGATTTDTPIQIDVLANDSDPDDDPLEIIAVDSPTIQGGTASINDNGTGGDTTDDFIDYAPPPGFTGPPDDFFGYTISDGSETDSALVAVSINVACPATPTGSFFDDLEGTDPGDDPTGHNAGWTFDPAVNTTIPPDNNWRVVTDPFPHSPAQSFSSDAINKPGLKDDRLVSPPMLLSSTSELSFWHRFRFAVGTGGPVDGAVLEACFSDSDPCGPAGPWLDITDPTIGGVFTLNGYAGVMRSPGNPGVIPGRAAWTGNSTFVDAPDEVVVDLSALDGREAMFRWRNTGDNTAVIGSTTTDYFVDDIAFDNLLEQDNCPPVAVADTATTDTDVPVPIFVLANDFDPNPGDTVLLTNVDPASAEGGTIVIDEAGTVGDQSDDFVVYTPPTGFASPPNDTFDYEISDGVNTTTGSVIVTVQSIGAGCNFTELLFADDWETGNNSNWDFVRNPQGDLTVVSEAALDGGGFGMQVHVDHSASRKQRHHYVTKTHDAVDNYCFSFLFDPNSIAMPNNKLIRIWGARADDNRRLLDMAMRKSGGAFSIGLQAVRDGGNVNEVLGFFPIPNAPVLIQGEWQASSSGGASDGVMRLYVDGELAGERDDVFSVSRSLITPGMGNLGQFRKGTLGDLYFDQFIAGHTP